MDPEDIPVRCILDDSQTESNTDPDNRQQVDEITTTGTPVPEDSSSESSTIADAEVESTTPGESVNDAGPAEADQEEENSPATQSTVEEEEEAKADEAASESMDVDATKEVDESGPAEDGKCSETATDAAPEEMDVSETPAKADQATDTNQDESIHRTEEVDMENVAENVEKEGGDDPFDSLRQNTSNVSEKDDELNSTVAEESTINDSTAHDMSVLDETTDTVDEDTTEQHDESMGDDAAKSGVEESVAEDDLEQGKGVDEELSLLPDNEREITEADKERALLAEAETETMAEEVPVGEGTNENDDQSQNPKPDNVNESIVESTAPKEDEIIELHGELNETKCLQCSEMRPCQYTLLHETQTSFLCTSECVTAFRATNDTYSVTAKRVTITLIVDSEQTCKVCGEAKVCKFRLPTTDGGFEYLCEDACLDKLQDDHPDAYTVRRKRYTIEEIAETADAFKCIQCTEEKKCRFSFQQFDDVLHVCHENCLNLLVKEQADRFRVNRRSVRVRDLPKRAGHGSATIEDPAAQAADSADANKMLARTDAEAEAARQDREASFIRRCRQCSTVVEPNDRLLHWETMDFCNETCLGLYQHFVGSSCTSCQGPVQMTSLGKYCVRFGYEVRQFCRSMCLDEYKKGLKVCSYCQTDISKDDNGFLASIGGQFKDFCKPQCMRKYDKMCNTKKKYGIGMCSVCMNVDTVRVEVLVNGKSLGFCSNPCFSAFQFVNNISADKCQMCQKYFERQSAEAYTIYHSGSTPPLMYCSKICMNIYIITHRMIVPCQWCKVKKYNFDMIQKHGSGKSNIMLCSLNCLTLCEVSMNAISMKKQQCDKCESLTTPQYHLTMSDATIRNFCTYQCVMSFQSQFSRVPLTLEGQTPQAATNNPIPTGLPKRIKTRSNSVSASAKLPSSSVHATANNKQKSKIVKMPVKQQKNNVQVNKVPVISNVTSLATGITTRRKGMQPVVELEPLPLNRKIQPNTYSKKTGQHTAATEMSEPQPPPPAAVPAKVQVKTHIVTIPSKPKHVANKSIMCKPAMKSVDTQCRPKTATIGCQTDSGLEKTIFIPIPVPIYVPQPMHMYSLPTPIPVPFPLPIPVPIFIPTTRNSANGIMKEIKKIQDKMPTDPFEAELLMMAEMVAGDKKKNDSDSGSDDEPEEDFTSVTINDGAALGEDMLQMALKMAQEYEAPPAVDLESAMTTNTITPGTQPPIYRGDIAQHHLMTLQQQTDRLDATPPAPQRGRKRASPAQTRNARTPGQPNKRARRQDTDIEPPPPQPEPPREPAEKADANMCLKFTFGVNAWKQWVMTKNTDIEKSSYHRKTFKSDLLQLTADELNYSLCLFVKEVRKPNGSEYAPDTIYYLVLGIQQYLYENGRIDNIFTDPYYEKFTDCLDEVARKFSVLYNDSQYIVTRVEEEHLWECKQLGAHSPHVLLSTLMFFNTKHFNLTSVDEHMQLSFSHIMKHWKRNPNQVSAGKPNSRNVLLRFYPPQAALEGNSRKKKVYEQQENEENPLRCPVKLYEFYLSKCPESVKTRNDVFYLQPERSCVPDSPVWYSTQPLPKDSLCKMLHRVKMVKEINIALLTS